MTAQGKAAAAIALHRFGFGPAGDSMAAIAAIAGDPRGALLADLERPQAGMVTAPMPTAAESAREVSDFGAEQQAKAKLAARAKKQAETVTLASNLDCKKADGAPCSAPTVANDIQNPPSPPKPAQPAPPPLPQQLFLKEAKARIDSAIAPNTGFVERMVWFWSNHFCVSADKVVGMAGAYEREAIRPHVLGRFGDMLQAVESHPAMLLFLDNVESMGAESVAGLNRDRGLNENLARETMELHTLGVRSGYSQQDVTSYANVITGWSWIHPDEPGHGGEFAFIKRLHEPGDQTVLGKRYPDTGIGQGCAVLADFARHPATAQHIADKLVRHFVADEPPPSLVAKLAQRFQETDGNLKEVAKVLVSADESWMPQRQKLKTPSQWIVAMLRLVGTPQVPDNAVGRIVGAQATLGEALWRPLAPNGYPDTAAAWIDGVPHRLDIANEFANRFAANTDPMVLLDTGLGPLASADTRQTIGRAESRAQAVALLVMTPEFLRS